MSETFLMHGLDGSRDITRMPPSAVTPDPRGWGYQKPPGPANVMVMGFQVLTVHRNGIDEEIVYIQDDRGQLWRRAPGYTWNRVELPQHERNTP